MWKLKKLTNGVLLTSGDCRHCRVNVGAMEEGITVGLCMMITSISFKAFHYEYEDCIGKQITGEIYNIYLCIPLPSCVIPDLAGQKAAKGQNPGRQVKNTRSLHAAFIKFKHTATVVDILITAYLRKDV